ncbi:alpha/beta fold hydrolase [Deinococcus sp.]|uniref:alpha/beta fold hydrolase n=1 Tax=Deinococcus sp. TaxID=47478 RepID=UPI003B58B9CB
MTTNTVPNTAPAPIPGLTRHTAQVGDVRLSYGLGGPPDGPAVLLWHGFLGTSYSWHKVAERLTEAGCAVLVPDMRGYGDSDKPSGTAGYDGRALAEDFRSLVRQIGFGGGRPLTLAAHDMGAPPALLWAADYPDEVSGLLYIEEPVMLQGVLEKIIVYTPQAMQHGSLWWWVLPLAPGVPESLMVGHERAFLNWFYEGKSATPGAISPQAVDEYLRTFAGTTGVLGALGVYRAAFTTIAQTEPLRASQIKVPVVFLGGEQGMGSQMQQMLEQVAQHITGEVLPGCGHFVPEERPEEVVKHVLRLIQQAQPST